MYKKIAALVIGCGAVASLAADKIGDYVTPEMLDSMHKGVNKAKKVATDAGITAFETVGNVFAALNYKCVDVAMRLESIYDNLAISEYTEELAEMDSKNGCVSTEQTEECSSSKDVESKINSLEDTTEEDIPVTKEVETTEDESDTNEKDETHHEKGLEDLDKRVESLIKEMAKAKEKLSESIHSMLTEDTEDGQLSSLKKQMEDARKKLSDAVNVNDTSKKVDNNIDRAIEIIENVKGCAETARHIIKTEISKLNDYKDSDKAKDLKNKAHRDIEKIGNILGEFMDNMRSIAESYTSDINFKFGSVPVEDTSTLDDELNDLENELNDFDADQTEISDDDIPIPDGEEVEDTNIIGGEN